MVRLAEFDFEIRHRPGKQHTNADGMSRRPLLKCAQCDICHQGAYETKRGKIVDLVMTESSTQTETPVKERQKKGNLDALPSIQQEGGRKELDELSQNSSEGPKNVLEGQVSKAREDKKSEAARL